jgi:hypothetical protein
MTHEDNLVEIATKPCVYCLQQHYVTVDVEGLEKWQAGAFVQVAFPNMPADVREMLISGTCPDCWEKFIKPLDEED